MRPSMLRFNELDPHEIMEIATDEKSVARYNNQYFWTDKGYDSFIFLVDGSVYGCDFTEPMNDDRLYKVV